MPFNAQLLARSMIMADRSHVHQTTLPLRPAPSTSTSTPPQPQPQPPSLLHTLPAELLDPIISFLDPHAYVSLNQTSRALRTLLGGPPSHALLVQRLLHIETIPSIGGHVPLYALNLRGCQYPQPAYHLGPYPEDRPASPWLSSPGGHPLNADGDPAAIDDPIYESVLTDDPARYPPGIISPYALIQLHPHAAPAPRWLDARFACPGCMRLRSRCAFSPREILPVRKRKPPAGAREHSMPVLQGDERVDERRRWEARRRQSKREGDADLAMWSSDRQKRRAWIVQREARRRGFEYVRGNGAGDVLAVFGASLATDGCTVQDVEEALYLDVVGTQRVQRRCQSCRYVGRRRPSVEAEPYRVLARAAKTTSTAPPKSTRWYAMPLMHTPRARTLSGWTRECPDTSMVLGFHGRDGLRQTLAHNVEERIMCVPPFGIPVSATECIFGFDAGPVASTLTAALAKDARRLRPKDYIEYLLQGRPWFPGVIRPLVRVCGTCQRCFVLNLDLPREGKVVERGPEGVPVFACKCVDEFSEAVRLLDDKTVGFGVLYGNERERGWLKLMIEYWR